MQFLFYKEHALSKSVVKMSIVLHPAVLGALFVPHGQLQLYENDIIIYFLIARPWKTEYFLQEKYERQGITLCKQKTNSEIMR